MSGPVHSLTEQVQGLRQGHRRRGRGPGHGGHPHLPSLRHRLRVKNAGPRRRPLRLRRPRQRLAQPLRSLPGGHQERPRARRRRPGQAQPRTWSTRAPIGCATTSSWRPTRWSSSRTSRTPRATPPRACPSPRAAWPSSASTTSPTASSPSVRAWCGPWAGSPALTSSMPSTRKTPPWTPIFMTRYRERASTRSAAGSATTPATTTRNASLARTVHIDPDPELRLPARHHRRSRLHDHRVARRGRSASRYRRRRSSARSAPARRRSRWPRPTPSEPVFTPNGDGISDTIEHLAQPLRGRLRRGQVKRTATLVRRTSTWSLKGQGRPQLERPPRRRRLRRPKACSSHPHAHRPRRQPG